VLATYQGLFFQKTSKKNLSLIWVAQQKENSIKKLKVLFQKEIQTLLVPTDHMIQSEQSSLLFGLIM